MADTSILNITYFLGAGASAKVLPTVKDTERSQGISTRLNEVAKQLEETEFDGKNGLYVKSLAERMRFISTKTIEFGTPDTYAKFLYLKENEKLIDFKNTLSAFF